MQANLVEVFSSIQGEGLLVGLRQVFIRFAGCNLKCSYCDTPESRKIPQAIRIEKSPGRRDFYEIPNPAGSAQLIDHLAGYNLKPVHSLSLTGGEPLLQAPFLVDFLPLVQKKIPLKIYLETNGTLADELASVIKYIDIIGMDIKLPGITGGRECLKEHQFFLKLADSKEVFVKMVVAASTPKEEFLRGIEIIEGINREIPLILQPITPTGNGAQTPDPLKILELQDLALQYLSHVRIIPQTHKFIGQL